MTFDSHRSPFEAVDMPTCKICNYVCDIYLYSAYCLQVMSQLLNYLKLDNTGDSIDWATLVVYTCSADCDLGGQYGKEFIWKQDFVSDR